MYKKFEGLLFDKDGTLFDFHLSWGSWAAELIEGLSEGLPARGAEIAKCLEFDLKNKAFRPGALSIAGTVSEQATAMLPALPGWRIDTLEAHLVAAAGRARMVPATPLGPLMSTLQGAGYRIGVATNDAESAARIHLEDAEIITYFDYIAGYDSGYGAKPDPGMCKGFADATGLTPASCAMIGDSTHDLIAGRDAGMTTIAVLTGAAEEAELAPFADAVLPDIGALPDWLERA